MKAHGHSQQRVLGMEHIGIGPIFGSTFVMCRKYETNLTCVLSKLKPLDIGELVKGWSLF